MATLPHDPTKAEAAHRGLRTWIPLQQGSHHREIIGLQGQQRRRQQRFHTHQEPQGRPTRFLLSAA